MFGIKPIGYYRDGRPLWPIMGGDGTPEEFAKRADEAFTNLEALIPELDAAKNDGKDRIDALKAQVDELAGTVAENKEKEAAAQQAADIESLKQRIEDMGREMRAPSKASVIGHAKSDHGEPDVDTFLRTLMTVNSPRTPSRIKAEAEEALAAMGSTWQGVPENSKGSLKATLGSTDATGGYIAPRAFVADFTTVGVANNPYRNLLTVVTGIVGPTVDIPHIGLAPTRATVIARGETKTNVGVVFSNYTATFYTLAQIHDAANQWLRQTQGRGEQIIRRRLGEAMALGEAYYILNGSGSSEPKGLLTSLGTSGQYVTSHTAAQTSIAGNIASGIAKANGDLASRSRTPTGVVMNAKDFWITLASGDDDAGFYVSPAAGATAVNATGGFSNGSPALSYWGLPIYADPTMPEDSLVTGAWNLAELYLGDGYRVDTSTEAGDRWDKNLTGFRAEEEIAFNADPYVASGLFQRLIDTKA